MEFSVGRGIHVKRWAVVVLLLVTALGAAPPAVGQVRDAQPACADITAVDASVSQRDVLVSVSLAAPSCSAVLYQAFVFADAGGTNQVAAAAKENIAGPTTLRFHVTLPASVATPFVAVTSSTYTVRLNLSSFLPPLTLGERIIDREPDTGTIEAHPVVGSLPFD
jgi:hypothetical protein